MASLLRVLKSYHLWLMVVMFAIGVVLHYPQQILSWDSSSLFSFLGFTRHAAERVFLLLPVAYAGFVFGTRAGLASLAVAFAIMLPRDLLISEYTPDALFETCIVVVIGGMINLWFHMHRRDITQVKTAEEALQLAYTEIEQIFKTTAGGICVIDKDFNIMQCNDAFSNLSNIPRAEILGKKCYEIFEHQLCHTDNCVLRRIFGGQDFIEFCVAKKGGQSDQVYLALKATPYKKPDGRLIGIIENFNDITQLKRAEESLHYYLQEITRAQEDERKRISRELHDSTTQNLIALLRQLENFINERDKLPQEDAELLWGYYQQIKYMLNELRRFSRDLRPAVLDDLGLIPALEWVTSGLKDEYQLEVNLEVVGDKRRLSKESELLLFRNTQEAVRNVTKHAQASKAEVRVEFYENKITISISDNGRGFQPPDQLENLTRSGKLGLAGMQERVKLLGGNLKISSEPGKGTTVFIEAPV
jgi:two-component system sensor histidine kinase DegS